MWVMFTMWCAMNAAGEMACASMSPPTYWESRDHCEPLIEETAFIILRESEKRGYTIFYFDAECVMVRGEPA